MAALAAIARERSFHGAADRLDYVQSAVSHQLAQLEEIVGARLVERSSGLGPVALTEAGALLLEHVEQVLARFELARSEVASLTEGRSGQLRVGVQESVAAGLMPTLEPRFTEHCPEFELITVPIEDGDDDDLVGPLRDGGLDLALCELSRSHAELAGTRLYDDPFVLLVPSVSPLAARTDSFTLDELGGLELVAHTRCWHQDQILNLLEARGGAVEVVVRSNQIAAIQRLVAAGVGSALVPRTVVRHDHPNTATLELSGVPRRSVGIAWHRDGSEHPAARPFVATARAAARKLIREE